MLLAVATLSFGAAYAQDDAAAAKEQQTENIADRKSVV